MEELDADVPSHINAETPGSIHEGGELGYALAVSFGAVMDSPDLIVTCVVGDGEAESGPTATFVLPGMIISSCTADWMQLMARDQIYRPRRIRGRTPNPPP